MEQEIWKSVVGFEGLYEASSFGRIKSLPKIRKGRGGYTHFLKERILKPQPSVSGRGEKHVTLRKNGKSFVKSVHRLVAISFIPNPNNLPQINHKDENPSNNRVDNLEWCDGFYNHNYGTIKERTKATVAKNNSYRKSLLKKISKGYIKNVMCLDDNGNLLGIYENSIAAGKATGVYPRSIRRCCSGEMKHSGGFVWKYLDKNIKL